MGKTFSNDGLPSEQLAQLHGLTVYRAMTYSLSTRSDLNPYTDD